ncbi:sulfite exporter TauE/SafE family protein [Pelagibaculum spongiae]|uniref:Probable membrane transporter protein n=1 Tax=Pelagibaculum spongiae TaxID=2080658 RepID=A0A2V1GWF2_9GAMM|nr:sulfite exporter TauE/SafE family protein [Pelagibaculum spongiae]PVZ65420.1 sulfite exporter TauE/SafE family protein [Pelagibaculum spongiae]
MDGVTLAAFLLIVGVGSYVQTVTGFALGMIVMGGVTLAGLLPIQFTSAVVSLLAISNGVFALKGRWNQLDLKRVLSGLAIMLPFMGAGLYLLTLLSSQMSHWLEIVLGCAIILGGCLLMLKPEPLKQASSKAVFFAAYAIAGLLAGVFALAGPPLVFLYYRQPFSFNYIRFCLYGTFMFSALSRSVMVVAQGQMNQDILLTGLLAVPIVGLATWAGRKFPPPLSNNNMRRLAFVLLIVLGSSLLLRAVF